MIKLKLNPKFIYLFSQVMLVTHLLIRMEWSSAPVTWIMTNIRRATVLKNSKAPGGTKAAIDQTWMVGTYVVPTNHSLMEWTGITGKDTIIL